MITMDILDYGIYDEGKHIADIDDQQEAIGYAVLIANERMHNVVVISNFTGEVIYELAVKQVIVEVEP